MKISGKEYLAAACEEDGCLYFWDIESRTSRKVFDPKLPMDNLSKEMNICKIDEKTIGYGEVFASLDESRRVFILKMESTEEWILSKTLRLFTPTSINEVCYTEVAGGIPCILLCMPNSRRIMAVEMEDGGTRWEAGKEQMGEEFKPWSICTDQNDCAFVADFDQRKIHLLSASDGTVIERFEIDNLYGFKNIFAVRFHNQHFYVERLAVGS